MVLSHPSTMIWAIDLDDGTLIDALGANLGRMKLGDTGQQPLFGPDLGSGWRLA